MVQGHSFVFDTNIGARVRFLRGAFKHGVTLADQMHVLETAPLVARLPASRGRDRTEWLFLGTAPSGKELEMIALLGRTEHFLVIHAMPMRAKWESIRNLLKSWETP